MASRQQKARPTLADMIRADVGEASVAAMGVAGNVSDSDTGREQITYVPRTSLVADPNNFYSVDGVDALAENIELVGLLDPLRVRPVDGEDGLYRIVSGHRRRAALDKLALEGNTSFEQVPVIIERGNASPAMQELRLIYANMDTRRMSSADISKQAERVEMLLYQLKGEGYEFPGKMRAHVAEACKVSETKLATLKKIREHLIDEWKKRWEADTLSESSAYTLAQMPEKRQKILFDWFGDRLGYQLYEIFLKEFGNTLKKIDNLKCPASLGGCGCSNRDNLRDAARARNSYYPPCRSCCEGCYDLSKCKYACSKFADKIAKLKADTEKRIAQEREQDAAREAERTALRAAKITGIERLWRRARDIRVTSGLGVDEFYSIFSDIDFFDDSPEDYDRGHVKIDASSDTPFGETLPIDEAAQLIAAADKLGVSLDYLLCRTDDPTPPGAVSESDTSVPQWYTGTPEREGWYWTFDAKNECYDLYWRGDAWYLFPASVSSPINGLVGDVIVKWYPLPEPEAEP